MNSNLPYIHQNYNFCNTTIQDSTAWHELFKAGVDVVCLSNTSFSIYPCHNVYGVLIYDKELIHIERLEKSWVFRFSNFMKPDSYYNFAQKDPIWLRSEGSRWLHKHALAHCTDNFSLYYNTTSCVNFIVEAFNQDELNFIVKSLKKLKAEDTEWGAFNPYKTDNILKILVNPTELMHKRFTNRYNGKPRVFICGVEVDI